MLAGEGEIGGGGCRFHRSNFRNEDKSKETIGIKTLKLKLGI